MNKLLLKLSYRVLRVIWFLTRPVTVGVRVMLLRGGQTLLVRHVYQDAWYMPGGGVKRGETLEQAVRREAWEECGARLHNLSLMGVYSNFKEYKSDHVVMFLCDDFELGGESDAEIEEMAFFDLGRLPDRASAGTLRMVEQYRSGAPVAFGLWS